MGASPQAFSDVKREPDRMKRLAMVVRRAGYERDVDQVCAHTVCPF